MNTMPRITGVRGEKHLLSRLPTMAAILASLVGLALVSPPPAPAALLQDDFDDGHWQGWTTYDGVVSVTNGALRIRSTAWGDDARAVRGDTNWTNYRIGVDFKMSENPEDSSWPCTVIFRLNAITNGLDNGIYYQFNIGPDLQAFVFINYASAEWLTATNRIVSAGVWHHLLLTVSNSQATAAIDGLPILSCSGLTRLAHGAVGLKSINEAVNLFDNFTVSRVGAPLIATDVRDVTARQGDPATFSVAATSDTPMTYQWWRGTSPLAGATNAAYRIASVQPWDAQDTYCVRVGNGDGWVTSRLATLTVLLPPSLETQPTEVTTLLGKAVSFQVSATGTPPFSYQWYCGSNSIAGATAPTLWVSNAGPAQVGSYWVAITNLAGGVASAPARLWLDTLKMYAGVNVYGPLGGTCLVQYATHLNANPVWTTLTNVTIQNLPEIILDDTSPGQPKRFYRILPQ